MVRFWFQFCHWDDIRFVFFVVQIYSFFGNFKTRFSCRTCGSCWDFRDCGDCSGLKSSRGGRDFDIGFNTDCGLWSEFCCCILIIFASEMEDIVSQEHTEGTPFTIGNSIRHSRPVPPEFLAPPNHLRLAAEGNDIN